MTVKSVFDIECFKDVKFGEENVLPYFTHCMEVACWHTGVKDVQQPQNPGPKPIRCIFYQIRN